MPTMTGAEMSKRILDINPKMYILLCTGHAERTIKEQWKTIGISGILNKPILTSSLLTAIRTVLDNEKEDTCIE
mgnify:CR=1 FL=1